jgi:glycosyltransferase involved in cell wall biosynthesis
MSKLISMVGVEPMAAQPDLLDLSKLIGANTVAIPKANHLNILAYVHLRNIYNSTGAGRTARQITEHLASHPDVNLRVLADSGDKARILPLVKEPWISFHYHTFSADTTRQQARWFFLNHPRAEVFWPEVDIVFCTGESYVPVKTARLVVTAHDAGYFEPSAHSRDVTYWKTRLKWELLYNKLDRTVDMFHTVSRFSADRLGHFFPQLKSRIRWVYNGVTPHFFDAVSFEGRKYLKEVGLSGRPFVLVPGGLHFRKNAELILAASPVLLQRFPDLLIVVVNHTNPVYAEKSRSVGPNFRILGFVTDEALHALYAAATVVWYPSRYEGFGLPLVEAMACGASVVASDSSSIPEIAGDAALLVDPTNFKAHADAICDLLTDSLAREQFSARGRERAKMFTWNKCASELKQHFATLL